MKSYEQYVEEIMKERGVSRKSAVQYMRRNPEKFPKPEEATVPMVDTAEPETPHAGDETSNAVLPAAEPVAAEGVVETQLHVGLLTETFNETLENAGLLSAPVGAPLPGDGEIEITKEDEEIAISAAAETAIQRENLGTILHVPAPLPTNLIVNGSMQETAPVHAIKLVPTLPAALQPTIGEPKAARKRRATAEPKPEGEQQPKGKPGRKGKVDAFDVETVKKLYAEGKKVVDIAVAVGYERGTGQNRVRNALIEAGVYKQSEKATE